jgi:DNA-binding LacI/PurR family transcriptional regulator
MLGSNPSSAHRVTLREVAAAAKVSPTAASFALNDSEGVSEACRTRVKAAAARLGYIPDKRVSEIMRRIRRDQQSTYRETLAILDTWPSRGGWSEPVANRQYRDGIFSRAAELGYELEEHWIGEAGMTPKRTEDILRARGIRGVIVPPVISPDASRLLNWNAFTAVTIGPSLEVPIHRVCNHRFRTVRTAIEHLIALGYSRLGFVMAHHPLAIVEDFWCSGFISYQAKLSGRTRVPLLLHEPLSLAEVAAWYCRHQPDAVLIHDWNQLDALSQAGLQAGRNAAIAYLNWAPKSKALAGVDQQPELMGAIAVDCLMGQLLRNEIGLPHAPQEIMVESVWRNGASAPEKRF